MYDFFYRLNTVQWYVTKIPARYRLMITFVLCVCIASVWFYAVWQPLRASIAFYKRTLQMHADATLALPDTAHARDVLEEQFKNYTEACDSYKVSSPFALIADIVALMEKQGLTFCSYQPQGARAHDWYTVHEFLIESKGSFAAMYTFFDVLQKTPHLVTLEKVRLSKSDNEQVSATCLFSLVAAHDMPKDNHV